MVTTPVITPYRHYAYEASTGTIWYSESKPPEELGFRYLGSSNNPIPVSAATVWSMADDSLRGCRVKPLESRQVQG